MAAHVEVGLWGSYHYGNFGDDLMAELFARQLRTWGYEPVVFSTNPAVVSPGVARVVPDIAGWSGGRAVVMGGGAMLSSDSWIEYLLRPATRAVEREFAQLLAFCRSRNPTVIPVSIGGGGSPQANILGSRCAFFSGPWAREGTVRLRGDVDLLGRRFDKRYECHPDVLFAAVRLLGRQRRPVPQHTGRQLRVGVNLHRRRAAAAVHALAALGDMIRLVPVITHSDVLGTPYEWGAGEPQVLRYQQMAPFLDGLAALDAIISDKLHVGLVAASLGVPFLSYQAKAKTRALHRELGVEEAVAGDAAALLDRVRRLAAAQGPRTLVQAIECERLDDQALNHLAFLRARLAACA